MNYRCNRCLIEQDQSQFYLYPDGKKRNHYCRSCQREIDRRRSTRPTDALNRNSRIVRGHKLNIIRALKNQPCVDCHQSFPSYVMDFDHLGLKTNNMSEMYRFGIRRIEQEAAQCEVVCANCHRIRTEIRGSIKTIRAKPSARPSRYPKDWKPDGPLSGKVKRCCLCKETRSIEYFGLAKAHSDGLSSKCKPCQAAYQARWHRDRPDERIAKTRSLNSIYREKGREYVASYKESRGCLDCGKRFPAIVLDFDHSRDKAFNIGQKAGRVSLDRIIQEIAKCEVVCANCHRVRTHLRRHST